MTSSFATIDADIRFAGSTEYSARAFRIALVYLKNIKTLRTKNNIEIERIQAWR